MSRTVTVDYTESLLIAVIRKPTLSTSRIKAVMEVWASAAFDTSVGVVICARVLSHLNEFDPLVTEDRLDVLSDNKERETCKLCESTSTY